MPEDMPDRMPEDMPDRMPEDMPDKMPEDMPDRMPEDMPDKMPEDMPDRMPEGMPDRMSDKLPEDLPDRMSENMPEDMPDRVPEDMPEQIAEDMPARMPEDMPDKMPEGMSDRMPEDLPVTKCKNVMMGITRSKVIFKQQAYRFGTVALPVAISHKVAIETKTLRFFNPDAKNLKNELKHGPQNRTAWRSHFWDRMRSLVKEQKRSIFTVLFLGPSSGTKNETAQSQNQQQRPTRATNKKLQLRFFKQQTYRFGTVYT